MKRFVETTRFADPWYFELPPEMKCAWEYVWANCDNAGVWNVNMRLADVQIGKKVDWKEFLKKCQDRILALPNNRWFVKSFVPFQCGTLSENSRPHAVVIGLLRGHGLMKPDSLSIDYTCTIHSAQDIYQEEEQDPDKDKDKPPQISKDRGTLEELKVFAVEIGQPATDGEGCFQKWVGNGWTNGGSKIKDWRATMRSWKANRYLPSQLVNGKPAKPNGQYPEDIKMPIL